MPCSQGTPPSLYKSLSSKVSPLPLQRTPLFRFKTYFQILVESHDFNAEEYLCPGQGHAIIILTR